MRRSRPSYLACHSQRLDGRRLPPRLGGDGPGPTRRAEALTSPTRQQHANMSHPTARATSLHFLPPLSVTRDAGTLVLCRPSSVSTLRPTCRICTTTSTCARRSSPWQQVDVVFVTTFAASSCSHHCACSRARAAALAGVVRARQDRPGVRHTRPLFVSRLQASSTDTSHGQPRHDLGGASNWATIFDEEADGSLRRLLLARATTWAHHRQTSSSCGQTGDDVENRGARRVPPVREPRVDYGRAGLQSHRRANNSLSSAPTRRENHFEKPRLVQGWHVFDYTTEDRRDSYRARVDSGPFHWRERRGRLNSSGNRDHELRVGKAHQHCRRAGRGLVHEARWSEKPHGRRTAVAFGGPFVAPPQNATIRHDCGCHHRRPPTECRT